MKWGLINLKKVTILSALLFLLLSSTAYGKYYNMGYSLDVIGYNAYGTNGIYYTTNAAKYWNDAANTRIGPGPQSKNSIAALDYNDEWLGLYMPQPILPGSVTQFSICINERTLKIYQKESHPGKDYRHLAINTTVHELGHALFLDDLGSVGNISIMSNNRDRFNHVPRTQDVKEIKANRGY